MPESKAHARVVEHPKHGQIVEVSVGLLFEDKPGDGITTSQAWPLSPGGRTEIFNRVVELCTKHNVDYQTVKPVVLKALENPADASKEVVVGERAEGVSQEQYERHKAEKELDKSLELDEYDKLVADIPAGTVDLSADDPKGKREMENVKTVEPSDGSILRPVGEIEAQLKGQEKQQLIQLQGVSESGLRRRALAKLTLEEQKILGLADPRRLTREEFVNELNQVLYDAALVGDPPDWSAILNHFDCMEELNK